MATQPRKEPFTYQELGIIVHPGGPAEQDSPCPKCSHTRKKKQHRCLSVNVQSGTFYCHHCFAHGSLITGWSGEDGGDSYGSRLPPIKEKEIRKPRALPDAPPPAMEGEAPGSPEEKAWDIWVRWFGKRGISELTMRRNRLTVKLHYMRDADQGNGEELWVICYPYLQSGEHFNTKFRTGPKELITDPEDAKLFSMEGGARRGFYGLDDVTEMTDTIIFVEGENDKLALEEAGWMATKEQNIAILSVPDGAPSVNSTNYDSKFAFMDGTEELFRKIKKFVIAVDADAPGRKLGAELARRIGPEKCWRIDWGKMIGPDGEMVKDANDALLLFGPKLNGEVAKVRSSWPIDGMFMIIDHFGAKLQDRWESGPKKAMSTGWPLMDPSYNVMLGATTLATGVPNVGKSTFLNALAINMMMNHDMRFAICSPEWMPIDDQIQAMLKVIVGKMFDPGSPRQMTRTEREWATTWLHERCVFILPEVPTVDAILDVANVAVKRMGVRGLIIDPWSEIETSHLKPNGVSQTDWIGQNLRKIKRWTVVNEAHTWVAVHPTKLEKGTDGEWPIPNMYDMSGSAKFADMADFILSLWRSNFDEQGKVEVWIQKSRFRHAARRGDVVKLFFDEATGRFSDEMGGLNTGTTDPWNAGNSSKVAD